MGNDWGSAPIPGREHCSLHPFFASRRFKSFLSDDAHARRIPKMIKACAKRIGKSRNLRFLVGLESRARCAGFSVMKIGNRKKHLCFYASFPDVWGNAPSVSLML